MDNRFGPLLFQSEPPISSKVKIKTISFIPIILFLMIILVFLMREVPTQAEVRERAMREAVIYFSEQWRVPSVEEEMNNFIPFEEDRRGLSSSEALLIAFSGLTVLYLLWMILSIEVIRPSQLFVYEKGIVLKPLLSSKGKIREISFAEMKGVLFNKHNGEGMIYQIKKRKITLSPVNSQKIENTIDQIQKSLNQYLISHAKNNLEEMKIYFGNTIRLEKGILILYTKNQEKVVLNSRNTQNVRGMLKEVNEAHAYYLLDEISKKSIDELEVRFGNNLVFSKGEFYQEFDEIPLEEIHDVYFSSRFLYFERKKEEQILKQVAIDHLRLMNLLVLNYLVFRCGMNSVPRSYYTDFYSVGFLHTKSMKDFEKVYEVSDERKGWLAFSAPFMIKIFESSYTFKMKREILKPSLKRKLEEDWGITDGETALEVIKNLVNGNYQAPMIDAYYHGLISCQIVEVLEEEEKIVIMDREMDLANEDFLMEEYLAHESAAMEKYYEIEDEFKEILVSIKIEGKNRNFVKVNPVEESMSVMGGFRWISGLLLNAEYTSQELCELKSLAAWDYGRVGALARISVHLGYLEECEAWKYIRASAEHGRRDYNSWREYLAAYFLGQALTEKDYSMDTRLIIEYMLVNENSPFIRLPF